MKITLALIALLGSSQALRLRDDDLFSDEGDVSNTLASVQAAEKVHGAKF